MRTIVGVITFIACLYCSTIFGARSIQCKENYELDPKDTLVSTPKNHIFDSTNFWQIMVSMGRTYYQDAALSDKVNPFVGRVSVGFTPIHWKRMSFGLEAGFQSGGNADFAISKNISQATPSGGISATSFTISPMADLVGTVKLSLLDNKDSLFIILKGGLAHRRLHFTDKNISCKNQTSGEFQAGVGVAISPSLRLHCYYQGIYSGPMNLKFTETAPYVYRGEVRNISSSHSVFMGLAMIL